jgi:hypothetical protein
MCSQLHLALKNPKTLDRNELLRTHLKAEVQKHVARLEVAVNDRGLRHLVQILQPAGHIQSDLQPGAPIQRGATVALACRVWKVWLREHIRKHVKEGDFCEWQLVMSFFEGL